MGYLWGDSPMLITIPQDNTTMSKQVKVGKQNIPVEAEVFVLPEYTIFLQKIGKELNG